MHTPAIRPMAVLLSACDAAVASPAATSARTRGGAGALPTGRAAAGAGAPGCRPALERSTVVRHCASSTSPHCAPVTCACWPGLGKEAPG